MTNDFKCEQSNADDCSEADNLYPGVINAIEKIAIKEGYISHSINKKMYMTDGGNSFGVLYEINIKGDTVKGSEQETSIFVKQKIPNNDFKLMSLAEIFNKELFIYSDLARVYNRLQDNAHISEDEKFKFVKVYDGSNSDALLLENLTARGFKTYGKLDIIPLNYAEICIEQLAKFHALSFVTERNMAEYYENKIKPIKLSIATISTDYKLYINKVYELATRKFSPDLKIKADEWWKTALDKNYKYAQGAMTAVKCLCHGDYKANNIMYRKEEGKPKEVMVVDYQLAHYGSPVLDLIFFMNFGTDQKFRMNNLDHLKNYYHETLTRYLEHFDVSVDDVYPKKEFDKDFDNCLDYALIISIIVMPFVLNLEDGEPDLAENEIVHIALKFGDSYYDRIEGIFDDFFTSYV